VRQRLSELPVANEVHVLLEVQQIGTDTFERFGDWAWKERRQHLADNGLGEILQPRRVCTLDELVEIERQVRPLEMFVKDIRVGRAAEAFGFRRQHLMVGAGVFRGRREERQERFGLLDLFTRIAELAGVIPHHGTRHLTHVPAGIRVVAHIRHAVRAELP
jgi:hypothetical protein